MARIRVGLIGLSAGAKTSWAAEAHLPYLLSAPGREQYELVALCNSSEQAARRAVEHFDLPGSTRTYGSPAALAADPDIDLVVVTTRVDVHYDTVRPSIEAGKAAFVEWPLAENVARAKDLASLAEKHAVRTMVGTQRRVSPVLTKVREVIGSGLLGTVLSSEVKSFHSLGLRTGLPEGLAYFTDRKVGGNNVTIAFGHMIDYVHSALGEFKTWTSHAQIQQKQITIFAQSGNREVPTDVPDYVFIGGKLRGSKNIEPGATLTVTFRRDPIPFPGEAAFVWYIYGDKAQLKVTSASGPILRHSSELPVTIELAENATGEVKRLEWDWQAWRKEVPVRARNVGELYHRFATGGEYPTFQDAVLRHAEIESITDTFSAEGF